MLQNHIWGAMLLIKGGVIMYEVMTAGQLAHYLQLDEQTVYRKG